MDQLKQEPVVNVVPYNPAEQPTTQFARPPANSTPITKKNSRAYKDIIIAWLIISVPMVVLSGALLGVIYANRITQNSKAPAALQLPNAGDGTATAFLVDFSATRLVTIASLTSSVAPFLPGFVMSLLSFPAARRLLKTSSSGQTQRLPTPFQLGLHIQLLTGGMGPLFQCFKYKIWKKRETRASTISFLAFGLSVATILGYLILAADTWLHVATSTVQFHQISQIAGGDLAQYGRGFYSNNCDKRDTMSDPCSVMHTASSGVLMNSQEAYRTVNNLSSLNTVSTFDHDGRTYAGLFPANPPQTTDYRANTLAVSTICTPATKACNMKAAYGASTPFKCNDGFYGDVTADRKSTGMVLLESPDGAKNITISSKDLNPFYLGTWALVDTGYKLPSERVDGSNSGSSLQDDPNIVTPVHGGMAWVLNCTAAVFDVTYGWVNGSVHDPVVTLSNATDGGIIAAPLSESFADPNFENNAKIASFSANAEELAEKWAGLFSQTTLALSSGVLSPRPNILEQRRQEKLVARVPKAPLFVLVLLCLIYAAIGVVLALYAFLFSGIWRGTGAARQRLSIQGVVAAAFEDPARARLARNKVEEMFVEREGKGYSSRLGVVDGQDGGVQLYRV